MNHIQKFTNEQLGAEIRVIDRDGEPWFVAKDVSLALGYANPEQAVRTHCKGVLDISTPTQGGVQSMKIIPESDLYRLILKSQKPEAEAFQDWIVCEVLPSIRKHGAYLTDSVAERVASNPQTVYEIAEALVSERQRRTQLERRENVFGNRTPYGSISERTGQPRMQPVRGYLRSSANGSLEFVPDAIQLDLFGC